MGGEAGRAPSGGLRSCACSRTGWGRHHHHQKNVIYHLLTIIKVKIITLFMRSLYKFLLIFLFLLFYAKFINVAYGVIYRNLLIVIVDKDVFICVSYSKHSKQMTRSLQKCFFRVQLLPQQPTSVGNCCILLRFQLFFSLNSVCT